MQHLNMTSAADSAELAVHVSAASELVELLTGPVIIREFSDVELGGRGAAVVVRRRPVVALVSVTPSFGGGAPVAVSELRVHPSWGEVSRTSGVALTGGPFDVTYRAGRAATVADVPAGLALACRVIAAHMWETQRAVTLGGGPGLGPEDFAAAPAGAGYAVPYRARDLLMPYMQVLVA